MFGRILVDDKEAQSSLQKTDKSTKSLGDRLRGGIKTAAKWGVALVGAATAVGAGMFALVNKATAAADAIAKGSERMGVSTDFYQEMTYWASQNGIAHAQMEKAVGRLNQRIGMAANGNTKYADALKRLGINMDEVKNGTLSTEDAFAQSIQSLSEMTNEQEKAELATEMFGVKLARDLLPALNDGSLSIDEAKKKAQELGLVLAEDQLYAAETFQDSWDNIKRSLGAAATQIGLDLMPMFQLMMDWVLSNMPIIRKTFSNIFNFISGAVGWVVEGISNLISWLGEWRSSNETVLSGIWEGFQSYLGFIIEYWTNVFETIKEIVTEVFSFISEFIREILNGIYTFWQENGTMILDNAREVFGMVRDTVMTVFHSILEAIQSVLEQVVPFVQEKLQVLSDFWAENGEQIMEAVQNAFSFIQSVIEFIMPAIQFVIEMIWGLIQGIINGALNIIMGLIKTFSGLFTGDWSKMWEGIKQLLAGALEFVWNLINLTLIGRGIALIKNFATLGVNLFRGLGGNIRNIFTNIMSTISNIVSRIVNSVLGFFRNMRSGITGTIRGIFTGIRNTFNNILSFIKGLGKSFLNAGKGLIEQIAKGITGAISKVTDAVKGVVGKVRDFLPFSPAKVGPLSDLDKLDFKGPIEESLINAEHDIQGRMAHLLTLPNPNVEGSYSPGTDNGVGQIITLIIELIEAIRQGKNIIINDKVLAKETGDARAENDGKRVRNVERELAT